ncbi:hypothetical protein [Streptomyces sp. NPDC029674]|uniref:hypothetical protein n=1 Tax=Streptomyces sp. NPDC029674 TaxID=3365297 RepID=UPI00384C7DA1
MPSDGAGGAGKRKAPGDAASAGCLISVLLAGVLIVAGLAVWNFVTHDLHLTYAGRGSTPVSRAEVSGGKFSVTRRYLTWDVRRRAESGFRVEGPARDSGFEGNELHGVLSLSVPRGCVDRRIRWEVRVDGARAGGGSLRWLRAYTVQTDFALHRTPDAVAITMSWDGGDAACPSFSAEWEDPRVERLPIG